MSSQNVSYNFRDGTRIDGGSQVGGKVQNNGKSKVYGDSSSIHGGFVQDRKNGPNLKKRRIMQDNDKYADEGVVDDYADNKENQHRGNGQQKFNHMMDKQNYNHRNHRNHNNYNHGSNGGGHGHTYNGKINNGGYNGNPYRGNQARGKFGYRGRGYRHPRHRNYGRRDRGNYPSHSAHHRYERGSLGGGYVNQYNQKPSLNNSQMINNDNNNNNTNNGSKVVWNNDNNKPKLFESKNKRANLAKSLTKYKELKEVFTDNQLNEMRHCKTKNKCLLSIFGDGNEESEVFHEILELLAGKHKETYFVRWEYSFVRKLKEEMPSIKSYQSLPVVVLFINGKPVGGWNNNYNWAKNLYYKFDVIKIEQILHSYKVIDNLCITPNIQHLSFDQ